jgi:hypothetical protein
MNDGKTADFEKTRSGHSLLYLVVVLMMLLVGMGRVSASGEGKDLSIQKNGSGTVVKMQLRSAPFPHPDRREGHVVDGQFFPFNPHYSNSSVMVFIPDGYQQQDATNLVFFFHGHYSSIEQAERGFSLFRQFADSGVNALLVLVETARNAPDSFGGKLEDEDGFGNLVDDLLATLQENDLIANSRPGAISLAGHSGGYRVISEILAHGGMTENIEAVYLFEGLYAGITNFSDWIEQGRGRFVSVYSINGGTSEKTEKFIESLRDTGVPVAVTHDDPSMDLRGIENRVVFVQSDNDHYGVVTEAGAFRRLLQADISTY